MTYNVFGGTLNLALSIYLSDNSSSARNNRLSESQTQDLPTPSHTFHLDERATLIWPHVLEPIYHSIVHLISAQPSTISHQTGILTMPERSTKRNLALHD